MFLRKATVVIAVALYSQALFANPNNEERAKTLLRQTVPPTDEMEMSSDIEFMELRTSWLNARADWLIAERKRLEEEDAYRALLDKRAGITEEKEEKPQAPALNVSMMPRVTGSIVGENGDWIVSLIYPDGRPDEAVVGGDLLNGGRVISTKKRSIVFEWGGQNYTAQ